MSSPSLILSPSFFSQRAMVPICIVGDSAGSVTCEGQGSVTTQTDPAAGITHRTETNPQLSLGWEAQSCCKSPGLPQAAGEEPWANPHWVLREEAVAAPSLELFKVRLNGAWRNLG